MKFQTQLFAFLLFFLIPESNAQDLRVEQGSKLYTFKTGKLIRVDVPADEDSKSETCPQKHFVGRLISYKNDTLSLRVRHEGECIVKGGKKIGTQGKGYSEKEEDVWPLIEISRENIISVTKQGSKHWKKNNKGDMVGGIVLMGGLIQLASAGFADGESNQDALVASGLTLTGLGIVFLSIFDRKTYHIENNNGVYKGYKTWNIQ